MECCRRRTSSAAAVMAIAALMTPTTTIAKSVASLHTKPFIPEHHQAQNDKHFKNRNKRAIALNRRIVNGGDSEEGDWPWFTSLRSSFNGQHYCGASLIKPDVVLTAAHCVFYEGKVDSPSDVLVNVGSHTLSDPNSGQIVQVESIKPHPSYNDNNMRNDIAIIRLSECVADVTPINLDSRTEEELFGDDTRGLAAIIGHGTDEYGSDNIQDVLQEAETTVLTHQECVDLFDRHAGSGSEVHKPSMICGSTVNPNGGDRVDTCQGDSGGPFVLKKQGTYVLTGVTSWGYNCASKTPGVYARVSNYISWIEQNAASDCAPASPTESPVTSSPIPPTTPSPTRPPVTSAPTTSPVESPPNSGCRMAACGRFGRCVDEDYCAQPTEMHAVRCCSNSKIQGWTKRDASCPWTASKKFDSENKQCEYAMTYSEARDFCAEVGGRLCTLEEAHSDCLRGTGCGHDANLIWTSSAGSVTTSSSTSTTTTTSSTSTSTSTTSTTEDSNGGGGSLKSCSQLGWPLASGSNVCGESDDGWSCNKDATYQEAADTCDQQGARLCTEEELMWDNAGRGTGCGLNSKWVWSNTHCTTSNGSKGRVAIQWSQINFKCRPLDYSGSSSGTNVGVRCCADV